MDSFHTIATLLQKNITPINIINIKIDPIPCILNVTLTIIRVRNVSTKYLNANEIRNDFIRFHPI